MIGSLLAGGMSQVALVVGGVLAARILGVQDRGYFALLLLVPHIISQLANLGLPFALTYFIARDPASAGQVVRSVGIPTVIQLVIGLLIQASVLLVLLSDDPSHVRDAAIISMGLLPGILSLQYGLAILQGCQRFQAFNILRTMPNALYSTGILFIFLFSAGDLIQVTAVQLATLSAIGGATAALALQGTRASSTTREIPSRRKMIRFGTRGLVGYVSPIEAFRIDQALVGLFLTPAALGLYVVGVSLTNLPRFLSQSVGMVAYPRVASTADPHVARRLVWRYLVLALALSAIVVVPLELSASVLIRFFFGDEFAGATSVARILLVGTVFTGVSRVLADGARGLGHPGAGSVAEFVSWAALVPAVVLLLPLFGPEGVALALTIAWFVSLGTLLAILLIVTDSRIWSRREAMKGKQVT